VLRQTARHAEAAEIDTDALWMAADAAGRTDALISLVADGVGSLDIDGCVRALREAERAIGSGDDRAFVRLDLVRTEVALLTGRPADAVVHARSALTTARAWDWPRHVAKSSLFAGAACDTAARAGDAVLSAEAERHLREAAELAEAIDARPIAREARALLAAR
jgi:hypothetical protein